MKQIVTCATTYRAHFPEDARVVAEHLAEKTFLAPQAYEDRSFGFAPVRENEPSLLLPLPGGGFAFKFRVDEKIIPGGIINARLTDAIKEFKVKFGKRPNKAWKKEERENIRASILPTALVKSTIITCLYNPEHTLLFVASTRAAHTDLVTSTLVHAIGSLKTETIHVSDVKGGLTTRLKAWIDPSSDQLDAFNPFSPRGAVTMVVGSERMTIKVESLGSATDALTEAIKRGFSVTSIRLETGDDGESAFTLTSDFKLRSIDVASPLDDDADHGDIQAHQLAVELAFVTDITEKLCAMFEYKDKEQSDAE